MFESIYIQFSNSAPLYWRLNLIDATTDPYIIKINITCVPLYFWGLCLNFTALEPVRSLVKVVPDASSHSYLKCPTYSVRELLVTLLLGLAEKQHVGGKKNTSQEKWFKVLERRIKWTQFQRGNNGGHGVWCSYAGHENDLVDDGINHTSVALNVNEDMFGCFLHF